MLESINSLYNNYHSDENPQIAGFLNVINLRKMIIKREQVIRKADCFCLKKNQISKLENLVGSHVGIVRSIGQVKLDQTDPNIVLLSGKTGGDFAVDGGALDWNWDRCKVRAISECIERYCWKNYRHNIIFTSWDDLNENERIPINYFNIYSEEQYKDNKFPYKYFEEDKMMDWIPMYRIRDNKKIYVPAEIILANPGINIGIISPRTSTGVAAGGSKQFAIKYAVLELIERDTVSRNLLMNKDIFLLNSRELRRCKSYRRCLEVNLNPEIYFLKNKFNIPVIMCRLVPQDTEDSIISYGFASGTDFITTIDKAIMESILMRIYIRSKLKDEKNISETNGALFNLRNSKESFFENISFNNSDDINEFNIEYDINDVYKSNDIYYHDITMNDAELVNISVVATWSPSMLDFVESKDLAPLNILKCDVKDLIDGKLPF